MQTETETETKADRNRDKNGDKDRYLAHFSNKKTRTSNLLVVHHSMLVECFILFMARPCLLWVHMLLLERHEQKGIGLESIVPRGKEFLQLNSYCNFPQQKRQEIDKNQDKDGGTWIFIEGESEYRRYEATPC